MAKTVQHKSGALRDTALVAVGWLAFFGGISVRTDFLALSAFLMAVARVLP